MQENIVRVLQRLPGGAVWNQTDSQFAGKCPSHDNAAKDSLTWHLNEDDRVVFDCDIGCSSPTIERALNLEEHELWPDPIWPEDTKAPEFFSEEAELSVIGSLLADPKSYEVVRGEIGEDDFFLQDLSKLYRAVTDLITGEGGVDQVTVADYIKGRGWDPDLIHRLDTAFDYVINGDSIATYAAIVARHAQRRRLAQQLDKLAKLARDGSVEVPQVASRLKVATDSLVTAGVRATKPGRMLSEIYADKSVMAAPQEIIPGIAWKGRSTLLSCVEKGGKSTLISYAVSQVSRGGRFLAGVCKYGFTIFIGIEEAEGDIGRRFKHFGADENRIYVMTKVEGATADQREAVLRRQIKLMKPILVVVDTLAAYGQGLVTDWNASAQAQPIVQSLTRLAHEEQVGLIIAHHASKATGSYRDSSSIGGGVDGIVEMFMPDQDSSLRKFKARGRMPMRGFTAHYDGQIYLPGGE